MPTSNQAFWKAKLAANQRRDALVKQQLVEMGWRTAIVWECATRGKLATVNLPRLLDKLESWIRDQAESLVLEIAADDVVAPSRRPAHRNQTT